MQHTACRSEMTCMSSIMSAPNWLNALTKSMKLVTLCRGSWGLSGNSAPTSVSAAPFSASSALVLILSSLRLPGLPGRPWRWWIPLACICICRPRGAWCWCNPADWCSLFGPNSCFTTTVSASSRTRVTLERSVLAARASFILKMISCSKQSKKDVLVKNTVYVKTEMM